MTFFLGIILGATSAILKNRIAILLLNFLILILGFIDRFYDLDDLMDTAPCYRKDKNHGYRRRWFSAKEEN